VKILLAIDDSPPSDDAIEEVATRIWPPNTTVRLLNVFKAFVPSALDLWYYAGGGLERVWDDARDRAAKLLSEAAESLRSRELAIETVVRDGNPRVTIVEEAKHWGADLIVIGSHGYRGVKRVLLGSVAQDVVSHAPCSVEVVYHESDLKKTVNDETRHKLIWGGLRLFLGFAQVSLVAMSVGALFTVGLRDITWVFVIAATAATVISCLIYRGRPDPTLKGRGR
jgi:nucleotide-binding universal stress UspA family protein